MKLILLNIDDPDIPKLEEMMLESKYFSISDKYFSYVTGTKDVRFYKIITYGELIGGVQCETVDNTFFPAIIIGSEYRRRGYAEHALKLLFSRLEGIHTVKVYIEDTNFASIALFEKLGFERTDVEMEYIRRFPCSF